MKPTDPLTVKNAKSYAKAKESYDAVINDAGRADWYCRNHRVSSGRHPSVGDCHMINTVTRPERRKSSDASIKEKTWFQNWINRPAY